MICGGIGDGAKQKLSENGIQLVSGIEGNIDSAVTAYLSGNLSDRNGSCGHGSHEHNGDCENHRH